MAKRFAATWLNGSGAQAWVTHRPRPSSAWRPRRDARVLRLTQLPDRWAFLFRQEHIRWSTGIRPTHGGIPRVTSPATHACGCDDRRRATLRGHGLRLAGRRSDGDGARVLGSPALTGLMRLPNSRDFSMVFWGLIPYIFAVWSVCFAAFFGVIP